MNRLQTEQSVLRHFSRLFCYPDENTAATGGDCYRLLVAGYPQQAEHLRYFNEFVDGKPAQKLEEIFTSTFELQPLCHPYVGYQLCGESGQRTMFMIKLKELYRHHVYPLGNELPDHLSEMLSFIGSTDDHQCRAELVTDALLPALEKLIAAIENEEHPYRSLLIALNNWLGEQYQDKGVLS
jgi:nitrate reductase delta subunit